MIAKNKKIRIIGVPMDLGQSQRGVDMGPGSMRYAGLSNRLRELGYIVEDSGNINVRVRESLNDDEILSEICRVCEEVYNSGRSAIKDGYMPLFLGGDHSISIGSIGGITHDAPAGIIWIDAHGDYNTDKTSTTGNIHGMALAAINGKGMPQLVNIGRDGQKVKPVNTVIIGLRDLDPQEKNTLKGSGVKLYTMRDIDEEGISDITHKALANLGPIGRVHVSLDLDCLDPSSTPGVGTPVPGGLTYREAHLMMEIIADSGIVSSMDIVEINPIIDRGNNTANTAAELAVSLFGKSIL